MKIIIDGVKIVPKGTKGSRLLKFDDGKIVSIKIDKRKINGNGMRKFYKDELRKIKKIKLF